MTYCGGCGTYEFIEAGAEALREYGKSNHVLFDVKYAFSKKKRMDVFNQKHVIHKVALAPSKLARTLAIN